MIKIILNTATKLTFEKTDQKESWFDNKCSNADLLKQCNREGDTIERVQWEDEKYIASLLHLYFLVSKTNKKSEELAKLLQLDYSIVSKYVENLEENGYSEEEIETISNHFMNGGMLSEIIAPPKKSKKPDPVTSLQEFDLFFFNRRNEIPGLADELIMKWARSKNK
jgi:hypothetical protein